jgi:hypothetical protein
MSENQAMYFPAAEPRQARRPSTALVTAAIATAIASTGIVGYLLLLLLLLTLR